MKFFWKRLRTLDSYHTIHFWESASRTSLPTINFGESYPRTSLPSINFWELYSSTSLHTTSRYAPSRAGGRRSAARSEKRGLGTAPARLGTARARIGHAKGHAIGQAIGHVIGHAIGHTLHSLINFGESYSRTSHPTINPFNRSPQKNKKKFPLILKLKSLVIV